MRLAFSLIFWLFLGGIGQAQESPGPTSTYGLFVSGGTTTGTGSDGVMGNYNASLGVNYTHYGRIGGWRIAPALQTGQVLAEPWEYDYLNVAVIGEVFLKNEGKPHRFFGGLTALWPLQQTVEYRNDLPSNSALRQAILSGRPSPYIENLFIRAGAGLELPLSIGTGIPEVGVAGSAGIFAVESSPRGDLINHPFMIEVYLRLNGLVIPAGR